MSLCDTHACAIGYRGLKPTSIFLARSAGDDECERLRVRIENEARLVGRGLWDAAGKAVAGEATGAGMPPLRCVRNAPEGGAFRSRVSI